MTHHCIYHRYRRHHHHPYAHKDDDSNRKPHNHEDFEKLIKHIQEVMGEVMEEQRKLLTYNYKVDD